MVRRVAEAKNALHYVTSPQSGKPRKWPPDTCGIAFEKLILRAGGCDHQMSDARSKKQRTHRGKEIICSPSHPTFVRELIVDQDCFEYIFRVFDPAKCPER